MKEEKSPEVKQHTEAVAPAPKKGTAKMVWMIVVIIAIIALIGSIAYGYMSMKKMNEEIASQKSQISELQNTKKTLEDTASAAATAATNAAAKAVGNAISGSSDSEKNQILASSSSFCIGVKNYNACDPSVSKQLEKYADVTLKDKTHLLLIKNSNGAWPVILSSPGSLCEVGVDGEAATAINKLCNR